MAYTYTNDGRMPDWKPDERNEVYIKVRPLDKDYSEKLIPIPHKIYESDSQTMNHILEQVKLTFGDSKVTVLTNFPKKGSGYIIHMEHLLANRIDDLQDLQGKIKNKQAEASK